MSLNSFSFIVSFIPLFAVLLLLQMCRKGGGKLYFICERMQILVMLAFSYYFLCSMDFRFGLCTAVITLIAYLAGRLIENCGNKRIFAFGGGLLCVIILCYYKYSNFFLNSIAALFHQDGVYLDIILPVGISFYTFTAISYMMDVYRGKYQAEKNLLHFSLFISFFPKVIAGPIIRGSEFLPQVKSYQGIKLEGFQAGIQIFMLGLFKKIVLADRLGVFVNDVFFAPMAYHSATVVLAVISYSLQIYFDFSGYSDMAIGISKMLGFHFSKNFNLPYLAENISDFWKRWHISLSSWLQDYIYIPLGGSRKGKGRTYLNLIIVMFISGLWHGAGYTFLVWGLLYGIANCIYKAWKDWKNHPAQPNPNGIAARSIRIAATFILVSLFWVIFRADSLSNAAAVFQSMFLFHDGIVQPYTWSFFALACLIGATAAAVIRAKRNHEDTVNGFYPVMDLSKFIPLVIFFTFAGLTILLGYFGNNAFIYGRF